MKKLLLLVSLLFITKAFSVEFTITSVCEDKFSLKKEIQIESKTNIGELTLKVLNENKIPHIGSLSGINTMFNTPVDLDSYEIISDVEMKVYGWCYEVNGVQPDIIMSQYQLNKNSQVSINWFFGYAHYLNDEWITYCSPVYIEKNEFICKSHSSSK